MLKRWSNFRTGEFPMVPIVRSCLRTRVEKIIKLIVYASADEKRDPVVDGYMVGRRQNQPTARNENAMSFSQHASAKTRDAL